MKKRIPSFLAGVFTTALVLTLTTTALAASGQVSFSFANIALNGETKISAGTTLTAANGQQIPSSILYTDAAGGKTNYLPIRAICDLLGVEIDYDSASKTILLGEQPQVVSTAQSAAVPHRWLRTVKDNHIIYTASADESTISSTLSSWQLTAMPKGWKLVEAYVGENGEYCMWAYQKGKDILIFTYDAASSGSAVYLSPMADITSNYQKASVNSASADFYQYEDRSVLVWENKDGMLCQLEGPLSQAELESIAATAAKISASSLSTYQLGWTPAGSTNLSRSALLTAVCEKWMDSDGVTFEWMYAATGAGELAVPESTPETVAVNGVQAKYWAGDPDAEGGIIISVGTDNSIEEMLGSPSEEQRSTLLWTDTTIGITFRIQGVLDKDTLIRMAENVK